MIHELLYVAIAGIGLGLWFLYAPNIEAWLNRWKNKRR